MASKYIRHGETYCGDGTTSAAATSNGGVGAWNNINVLEGSAPAYGSLAAGDVVYIRSKDNGGADITRTRSGNVSLGSTSGTAANPITWVIDGGTVWSGINGALKFTTATDPSSLTFRANNLFIAEQPGALWSENTATYQTGTLATAGGYVKNLKITSANTSGGGNNVNTLSDYWSGPNAGAGTRGVVENLVMSTPAQSSAAYGLVAARHASHLVLINPDIEITSTSAGQVLVGVESGSGGGIVTVIGGRVWGAGASSMTAVGKFSETSTGPSGVIKIVGTDIPRSMPSLSASPANGGRLEMVAVDGGIGSHVEEAWGWATSRTDNYPPYLSAQLPNSTLTGWAWRVFPKNASFVKPAMLPAVKLFTGAAATKTITLECLIATTLTPTARQCWMTVEYIDHATGLPKHMSTFDPAGAALTASSASWSASTWGLVNFNKRKLSVTTPTSIKQDTPITVTFWYAQAAASNDDVLFVDHDFAVA